MIDLETIIQRVEKAEQRKSDEVCNLKNISPSVGEDGITLRMQSSGEMLGTTATGTSSLLSKVKIPGGFFTRSSLSLKKDMMVEHYKNYIDSSQSNTQVLLRTVRDSGENPKRRVRFVASELYRKFDDVEIMSSISKANALDNFNIKEFHQTPEYMVLRVMAGEPLDIAGRRPYYPGVQIVNSEIGKSSVKMSFMLWEEVCTNGMTVARQEFAKYSQRHIGKKSADELASNVDKFFSKVSHFKDVMYGHLMKLDSISHREMMERMDRRKMLNPKLTESMEANYLPKYSKGGDVSVATGLDTMSAYTEAIQKYNWDSRLSFEEDAGSLMLDV